MENTMSGLMDSDLVFTKSHFSLGRDCPTKLYFSAHPEEYQNVSGDDQFLEGLKEGGYQVGEYARWKLCDNPLTDTIETPNKELALARTGRRLEESRATIAEAAFQHEHLFIRADIVVKTGNVLKLYEVKSKSWEDGTEFWNKTDPTQLSGKWEEYLLDVAFQKHVVEKACPGLTVQAHLVLLDKGKCASVDGLNQMFPIFRRNGRPCVECRFTRKTDLGNDVLAYINVDNDIAKIHALGSNLPKGGRGPFVKLIEELSAIHQSSQPVYSGIGSKCKGCPFRLPADPQESAALVAKGLKSGFDQCWSKAIGLRHDPSQAKILELWNFRKTADMVAAKKFYLRDLDRGDIGTGTYSDRQWLQVDKVKRGDDSPWIDRDGLSAEISKWKYLLHFIDFETSRMALPGHSGMPPYMQVAFQFSHHIVDKNGQVRHAGQWIEPRPGVFPSFEFVRALKKQLETDNGTIFRYATHENSVLRDIHGQLACSSEPDRRELMRWIDGITEYKPDGAKQKDPKIRGPRNMVDMRTLFVDHHYDPATHGSNSIKDILPAIIGSSEGLRHRYGRALGQSGIHSLNCPADWVWVRPELGGNPYASLPPVFDDTEQETLSEYVQGLDELDDGGAAMIAYGKLQYCDLQDAEREAIRSALLRYCELDTLAMVMLYEYWTDMLGKS
jgi:hypothetical protein